MAVGGCPAGRAWGFPVALLHACCGPACYLPLPITHCMESKLLRPAFNFNLEALRGVAAVVVVWHHVIYHERHLDPNYTPSGAGAYNPPGHLAVLIFFLLSGYVIGLSHPRPLRKPEVLVYLHKRFVRLYPMYVLAVVAGAAVTGFELSGRAVVHHLLFWQSWSEPVMFENNPLWSLQYEVLYYLAFIPLAMLAVRPGLVAGAAALLGLGALTLPSTGFNSALAQYVIGFAFWSLGWALSKLRGQVAVSWPRLVSALLLLLSLEQLNPLATWANELGAWLAEYHITLNSNWAVDYTFLPYMALIVLGVAGISNQWLRWLSLVLQLLPLYGLVGALASWSPKLFIPSVLYLVSLALYFINTPAVAAASQRVMQRLVPLGAISYGIYIIHFPIVFLFGKVDVFSGSPFTFLVRAVLYLALTFFAATWLEKVFQPWIKKRLGPYPATPLPQATT